MEQVEASIERYLSALEGHSTLSWGCEALGAFVGCSRRLLRN
jgi:hypothetical protein